MKILYIGHYSVGSTSKMRGEAIRTFLKPEIFDIVNIDSSFQKVNRIFRSIGFRYKYGPLITLINDQINDMLLNNKHYDLIWVDKGVYIKMDIIRILRKRSNLLIHFTPDPAFTYHRSFLFFNSIPYYDHCITTKSFETEFYYKHNAKNVIFSTQGYSPTIHKPYNTFDQKNGLVFIGHFEKNRANILGQLLVNGVQITLAGIGWASFVKKYKTNQNLNYLGKGVYGEDYGKYLSIGLISIGFLSKIIPELHTTRTIEIPACSTLLITEKNKEISQIFTDDEVIFVNNDSEIVLKTIEILSDKDLIKKISIAGHNKIVNGGFDYQSIICKILKEAGVSKHD